MQDRPILVIGQRAPFYLAGILVLPAILLALQVGNSQTKDRAERLLQG